MHRFLFAASLILLTTSATAQNLLVDGDLENHSTSGCRYNQPIAAFNAAYVNVHSFGPLSGVDIMQGSCFGSPAQSGQTRLGLAWSNASTGDRDAIALDLSAPLTAGEVYDLTFYAELLPFGNTPQPFDIGVSLDSTSFGSLVFSETPGLGWTLFTTSFVAPFAATHLTVQMPAGGDSWHAFDNFQLGARTVGTSYCGPGNPNSTGATSAIHATGDASASLNALTLVASSLPTNALGYFIVSRAQGFVTNPGGSAGNLCLGGAIGRYVGPGEIQNSGTAGEINLALDLTTTPTSTGFVTIQTGDTWYFQAWHRDAVGGVATSNFTDALSVTFL